MKNIFLFALLTLSIAVNAQAKKQKPIKLQGKTDNHKISYEMKTDIFYFTNTDLITFFQKIEGVAGRVIWQFGDDLIAKTLVERARLKTKSFQMRIFAAIAARFIFCHLQKLTAITLSSQRLINPQEGNF